MTMFKSLKKWLDVAVTLHVCLSENKMGDKTFAADTTMMVYPVKKTQVVVNRQGKEVTSSITLYTEGTTIAKESDEVTFEGARYPVKAIGVFYTKGAPDIKVVYL
jgi:thiamine pyrophosphokinase